MRTAGISNFPSKMANESLLFWDSLLCANVIFHFGQLIFAYRVYCLNLVHLQGEPERSIQCHGVHVCCSPLYWNHKCNRRSTCCFCWEICFIPRKSGRNVFRPSLCICPGWPSIFSRCTWAKLCPLLIFLEISLVSFHIFSLQVAIELPYVFAQSVIYCSIFYSMASFEWSALKFIWYTYFMYSTLLYFTFYGMMTTAVTPNHNVAAIIAAPFYMLWNLFCGFMIPHKVMNKSAVFSSVSSRCHAWFYLWVNNCVV